MPRGLCQRQETEDLQRIELCRQYQRLPAVIDLIQRRVIEEKQSCVFCVESTGFACS
jgi:hypothetical protein